MKKLIYSFAAFIIGISIADAKQVESSAAKQVAQNYIQRNAKMKSLDLSLSYTERSKAGISDYYVFDINNKTGFIIVSAEDAGRPIIGYSTESSYQAPSATSNPNFNFWMQKRKEEIEYMRDNNVQATPEISAEWGNYSTSKVTPQIMSTAHATLCATTWNQNGGGSIPYNNLCPGGSVTGCVATAMAQIMKKWAYPAQGQGQSSYNSASYGTLSANYGATTYNWANMPTGASNADVALISYQCGVSVDMNYSPSGSGAQVCGGNPSAQYSYVTYFKYDPGIHCEMQTSYTTAAWNTMLENEFNVGQPVQYQGFETQGGHTWVCDGNDASDNMHMNWGWGGYDNGMYAVTNLSPSGMGTFNSQLGGLFGIKPGVTAALDAGIASIVTPSGTTCNTTFTPVVKLQNFGSSTLTSCKILYHVDAASNVIYSWSGSLATGASVNVTLNSVSTSPGAHTFTSATSNPNGSADANTTNDQNQTSFNVTTTAAALPLVEGFESSASLPAGWALLNPDNDVAWSVVTTVAHTGTNCIGFNNCDGDQSTDMTGRKDRMITNTYNFSSANSSSSMTFDVGYIPASDGTSLYTDTLVVFASTDCGSTWSQIYSKGGTQLATGPQFTVSQTLNCVAPTSSQWRTDVTSLSSLAGQPSVMFAFENRSDWGNWVYLDNINITAATGVASVDAQNGFSIYPNPATSSITVEGTSKSEKVHYSICNMLGAEIQSGDIAANGNTYSGKINVSDISNGMYFIKVIDGNSFITKKLNKQ